MNREVASFLIGLAVIAAFGILLARVMIGDGAAGELPGATAGILAAGLSAAASFFPLRGALKASNLRFMRTFFMGLLLRVLFLAAAGLLVRFQGDWSLRHWLIAVGLSYPLYVILEGWILSRELPERRRQAGETEAAKE